MANPYERNGVWYLRVKNPAGKWIGQPSKARNKTEAKRLNADLDRKFERERLGLDPASQDDAGTLGQLLQRWLTDVSAGTPSHEWAERTITKHLAASELAPLALGVVTTEKVEAFLHRKGQEELGPQSLNHLRAFLSRAFNSARKLGWYRGANPISTVTKRRIARALPEYLRAHEVLPVLAALDSAHRALFATAIYSGLRKGELFGLQKSDVDLAARLLSVARSHERETTKGSHADAIPIAAELLPYLKQAIKESPSDLVFPRRDKEGSMQRADTKLAAILRRALARAGIVSSYRHVCRKKGCDKFEKAPDAEPRRCPTHKVKMWPKPQVRSIKFHSLRHTTASLLIMAGASPSAVRVILRHSDQKMTDIYSHLSPEFLRTEVDRLSFEPKRPEITAEPEEVCGAMASEGFASPLLQTTEATPEIRNPGSATLRNRGSISERRKGFEPSTPSLGSSCSTN
jgi:integrase